MNKIYSLLFLLFFMSTGLHAQNSDIPKMVKAGIPELVMVFTKTEGFRHQNIKKGVASLRALGRENGFIVLQSEDSGDFTPQNLKNYKLIVFLNTTGDIFNKSQQDAFEQYIKSGGSFMGIHAATDTEYEWPWFGQLVGAYFDGHPSNPNVRNATMQVLDNTHPSTVHLSGLWKRTDEWYNFKNLNPQVSVLLNLDETSYEGGTNGKNHPIAWYHELQGGRVFYTGGGHTEEAFDEPKFREHLLGAMEWCMGRK